MKNGWEERGADKIPEIFYDSGERQCDKEGKFSVFLPVSEIAVHGLHEVLGNIKPDSRVVFRGFARIIGMEDITIFADSFSVVSDGKVADIFLFDGGNPDVLTFGVFDCIHDDVADHGIQIAVFCVDGDAAGENFQKNSVCRTVRSEIF